MVTLFTDGLKLGSRVVRQVILPGLTRKGNLLSSLFLLFTGLAEQVIHFAEAVIRVPRGFALPVRLDRAWVHGRKWLRRGMLIATWALFILSSLEWTSTRPASAEPTSVEQTAVSTAGVNRNIVLTPVRAGLGMQEFTHRLVDFPPNHRPTITEARWLLLCQLRI